MKINRNIFLSLCAVLFVNLLGAEIQAQSRSTDPTACMRRARKTYRDSVEACDAAYVDAKGMVRDPVNYQACLDNALARYRQDLFSCRGKINPYPKPVTDPSRFPGIPAQG